MKIGHFYFGNYRTFLIWLDSGKRFLLTLPKIYVKWNYVFQINRASEK